ncbi:uncharacterized protein APUU_40201A [Aspergillus puulaauensis]|uniref:Uncharacterized protein n=1 Tax=Aspergillus puulaauensis TaxID=1220207 RepID=A0A7R8AMG3_9EURO|nr:uncharacterized protein APUU_40201A [Aspergillus puulaauensis]BCS23757.1 hypothetical protein APUU_40201A [Aspergillus puulaauensis]
MSFPDDGVELVDELSYWWLMQDPESWTASKGVLRLGRILSHVVGFRLIFCVRDWGLRLEQLYQIYDRMTKAWESQKFVSTVTFAEIRHVGGGEKERTHRLSEYGLITFFSQSTIPKDYK